MISRPHVEGATVSITTLVIILGRQAYAIPLVVQLVSIIETESSGFATGHMAAVLI